MVALPAAPAGGGPLAMFAQVLGDLHANGLKFRALVLGDGPARAKLRTKLPDAIFTGALSPDALAAALASADVFLDPGEGGAAECGTLEAMASGLPVVVADSLVNSDVVRNGVDGIVCRRDDRAGFALVVRRVVEHPAARENLRRAALRRAAAYHREALLGEVVAHYHRVLHKTTCRAQ